MGYMQHHAILVTSWKWKYISAAYLAARRFGLSDLTTGIVQGRTNGYLSFAIMPDGSKEGWPESETGGEQRSEWIAWANAARANGIYLEWVLVQYADDELDDRVIETHLVDEDGNERFSEE